MAMRLLHVHSGNLYGGVETLLATLVRFRNIGPLEHEFGLCFDGRIAAELRVEGVTVHRLGEVRVRHPLTVLRARARLRRLIRREPFDGVMCHSAWTMAVFGNVVKSFSLPLIFWLHGPTTGRHWLERWARRVSPDLVLCNSPGTAATLPTLYTDVPYEVLNLPVAVDALPLDSDERHTIREELGTPDRAVVIAHAGRFEPWKGHRVLLEALALIEDAPDWRCWIISGAQRPVEHQYLEQLRALARRSGIADRVIFCGERSDVARMLAAADIYCQPNTEAEGFGIALVEAMGAGLPVVTSGNGGIAEVIDESCGIRVARNDPRAVANALDLLLGDPVRRAQMGRAGISRATDLCDPHRQIARLASILAGLRPNARGTVEVAPLRVGQ